MDNREHEKLEFYKHTTFSVDLNFDNLISIYENDARNRNSVNASKLLQYKKNNNTVC